MTFKTKNILEMKNTFINEQKYKCINILGKKFFLKKQISFKETFRDLKSRYVFSKHKIRKNSVLLVEPNAYHGEILPGFVKYFQDLGFNVDLILRYENVDDCSLLYMKDLNIIPSSVVNMKNLLKDEKIREYEYCFFTSSALWDLNFYFGSFLKFLGFIPNTKRGIMLIEHNIIPCIKEFNEEKYLMDNRLFTLSGMSNTLMLNPHYFTDVIPSTKNKITTFITSGHDIKGLDLLIKSATSLLDDNITDFKIIILGKKVKIPNSLKKYIFALGHVTFERMYQEINNSDYILPMLDPNNDKHTKYLHSATFGARQQCLGFLKPMLINSCFAKSYGFDISNSIIYNDSNLYDAMKYAIEQGKEEYSNLQNNIRAMQTEIYNKSLNNLKKAIQDYAE